MTEKYKIEISEKAQNDLEKIVLYIKDELKEPIIASNYAKIIKKEIKNLEYSPQKFAIIDDTAIKDLNIRKLNIKNYIVFYRIDKTKKNVKIERILYGASNWINKL